MLKIFERQMCFNYILVKKQDYLELLDNYDISICFGLIDCIAHKDSRDYKFYLMAVSYRLYELHRLVYSEDNTITKLSYKDYEMRIFENFSEDIKEFTDRYKKKKYKVSSIEHDYESFILLKKAISKSICNASELIYMCEYAGLIDFIVNRKAELPYPRFNKSMFVNNWNGYDPINNKITEEFRKKYGLN